MSSGASRFVRSARYMPLFAVTILLGSLSGWASISGSISGVVRDPSGAIVPGAEITVSNVATGITQTTSTDSQGMYSFLALPVGRYRLEVKHSGFKSYEQTDIVLNANDALRFDVVFTLGAVTQTVDVAASAVHVETTSTQMGDVIGSSTMVSLPLDGRNFTDLLGLQPGVAPQSAGTVTMSLMGANFGTQTTGNISVSGGREDSNGFQVNGASVVDPASNGTSVIPDLDSIAEFRVLTNNIDAEYGQFSGGLVNIVTKSGSNQFHGDIFEFLRNNLFDARNFFSTERGNFKQNQFGGTIGGPVVADKVFFFADYQGTRTVQGLSSGEIAVPTAAERGGMLDPAALTGSVNGAFWANTLSQRLGYAVTSGEPYSSSGCTSASACVFPNGVIPSLAFSAAGKTLISQIPLPNDGPFFAGLNNTSTNDDRGSIRMDASNKWGMFSAYYFIDRGSSVAAFGSNNLPGFPTVTPDGSQQINFGHTKLFGAAKLNEFRVNYSRYNILAVEPASSVPALESQGFDIPAPAGSVPGDPDVSIAGVGSVGYFGSEHRISNAYEVLNNFSYLRGSHSLKFGGDFQFVKWDFRTVGYALNAGFSGTETGSPIADVLLGAPSYGAMTTTNENLTQAHYGALYAQDSWRMRPNLTLNYGLRWDVPEPWGDPRAFTLATMVLGEQSQVFPTAPLGFLFPGDPGVAQGIYPTHFDDIAPRIGVAYSPSVTGGFWGRLLGGPDKSSIRASFGTFYNALNNFGIFFNCAPPPVSVYYSSPAPPLLENPFVIRGSGARETDPFPFTPPKPGTKVNFASYLPITGYPFPSVNERTPYQEQYSLSLQRQLGSNNLLSLSYVGSEGHHLLTNLEANPGNAQLCVSLSQPSQVAPGTPTCGPFGENGVYTFPDGTIVNSTRGPFGPNFGSAALQRTYGNSTYNALEISMRHTSGPLTFLAGYTWSKALDYSSQVTDPSLNPYNFGLSRALSAFDVTHNFVVSYDLEIPFSRLTGGSRPRLTDGWRLSGITHFATGIPVTIIETDDRSLLGVQTFPGPDVPEFTPGPLQVGRNKPQSGLNYFNTSLFGLEPLGSIGTSNRRFFYGPGINKFDLALLKDLKLTDRIRLQFRGEFFNAFNHTQFSNPDGNVDDSTFGQVLSAGNPRIGQFAMKLFF